MKIRFFRTVLYQLDYLTLTEGQSVHKVTFFNKSNEIEYIIKEEIK